MPKLNQRRAAERILDYLLKAKDYMDSPEGMGYAKVKDPLDIKIRVFKNRDGSVDGEMRIRKIPRGILEHDIYIALDHSMRRNLTYTWLTIGRRYTSTDKSFDDVMESADKRYRGLFQAGTNYRKMTKPRIAERFRAAMDIDKYMRKKKRRKAEQIYVRLHWDKTDKQPKRR